VNKKRKNVFTSMKSAMSN